MERISVVRNLTTNAIGVDVIVSDGRRLPLLDGHGCRADLTHEVANMRSEAEAQAFFNRISNGVSGYAN